MLFTHLDGLKSHMTLKAQGTGFPVPDSRRLVDKGEETTANMPGTDPNHIVLSIDIKVLQCIVVLLWRNVSEQRIETWFAISGSLLFCHSENVIMDVRSQRGPATENAGGRKELSRQSVHSLQAIRKFQGGKKLGSISRIALRWVPQRNRRIKQAEEELWDLEARLTASNEENRLGTLCTYL